MLTLLIVALLTVRVGGAHLHLCFDGSEAPASLHLLDAGGHHEEKAFAATHQDVDLSLIGEALSKLGKADWDLPVFLVAAALLFAFISLQEPALFSRAPAPRYFPLHLLRPPLRGPPR